MPVDYELYNLVEDPAELVNVVDDPAYAEIRQELERLQRHSGARHPRLDWSV